VRANDFSKTTGEWKRKPIHARITSDTPMSPERYIFQNMFVDERTKI